MTQARERERDLNIFVSEREREREMDKKQERVCVTGAGGYVASWVVKYLLSKGYIVHGTVRDPNDEKNAHLKTLENATENLIIFKAHLLDYDSLTAAITGCSGVFHIASPVPSGPIANPQVELIEPALTGTRNVLRACTEAKIKRVVVVSSVAAVLWNPDWPKGQAMDESCWSDKEFCRKNEKWYQLAKTEAEHEALEYAKRTGLDVVTVCPPFIFGPMLQSTVNSSSLVLLMILRDGYEPLAPTARMIVDVRDVAEAVLLAYERPEAEGRYICSAYSLKLQDLVDKMKIMYPNYNYPKNITVAEDIQKLSYAKLEKLGWKYRPLEQTLADSVQDYQEKGVLVRV